MRPLGKRDLLSVLILGEIVGLFAYAIVRKQGISLPVPDAAVFPLLALGVPLAALVALLAAFVLGKRMNNPGIFQFGKFAAVGFSNTAIDWGILNLLLPPATTGTALYAAFKAISFGLATLNSFIWNRTWSFERKGRKGAGKEALQFYAVTALGLGINVGIATLIVNVAGSESRLLAGIIAPAFATAASMAWDFFAYRFIVFRTPRPATPSAP